MWKHKSNYKNRLFLGNYEFDKNKKRIFKLKDALSGKEIGPIKNGPSGAKKLGFVKIK